MDKTRIIAQLMALRSMADGLRALAEALVAQIADEAEEAPSVDSRRSACCTGAGVLETFSGARLCAQCGQQQPGSTEQPDGEPVAVVVEEGGVEDGSRTTEQERRLQD